VFIAERHNVCAYGVFSGTHLAGGPVPPTGMTTDTGWRVLWHLLLDCRDAG
jgi:hypothetical protein